MATERGRPRKFDRDLALDKALMVFWQNGFQGASLSTLTDAMGINKPSLYAAFGDKSSLYRQALQRYSEREGEKHAHAMAQETQARAAIRAFLMSAVRLLTDAHHPGGCFVVTGTSDCGIKDTPADVRHAVKEALTGFQGFIQQRLEQAQAEGDLPSDTNCAVLSAYFGTLLSGLAVQAKVGVTEEQLIRVVDTSLEAWPKSSPA